MITEKSLQNMIQNGKNHIAIIEKLIDCLIDKSAKDFDIIASADLMIAIFKATEVIIEIQRDTIQGTLFKMARENNAIAFNSNKKPSPETLEKIKAAFREIMDTKNPTH